MKPNLTIVASGTREQRMNNFEGNIPWINLLAYKEFIVSSIANTSVIVGRGTFEIPFFREILSQHPFVTVLSRTFKKTDCTDVMLRRSIAKALACAGKRSERVCLLGGVKLLQHFITQDLVDRIRYAQIDMRISKGDSSFPKIPEIFEKASYMSLREKLLPETLGNPRFQNQIQEPVIVPVEIQHWVRRLKS